MTRYEPTDENRPIVGQLLERECRRPLAGFRIAIYEAAREAHALGAAPTQLDGVFTIPLSPEQAQRLAVSEHTHVLVVRNRFGRVVRRVPDLRGRKLLEPLEILLELREEDDHPVLRPRPNPFEVFRATFEAEIAVLERAGVGTLERLLELDLARFGAEHELSYERLAAFRLAAEIGLPNQLGANDARWLVMAGYTSAEKFALAPPKDAYRALQKAAARGRYPAAELDPTRVLGWQMAARGWSTSLLHGELDVPRLEAAFKPVSDRIHAMNPGIDRVTLITAGAARMEALAEMRALMLAAGVHDLSSLGTFRVRGEHRISPGYYIASPRPTLVHVSPVAHLELLQARAAGFAKVKASTFTDQYLHILPNPVTEAIILGSVLDFLDGSRLIIGRDVSALTIITEEIRYSQVNSIEYEGPEDVPSAVAKLPDRPLVSRDRAVLNNPYVYTAGVGDNGRDGLDGPDGAEGVQGNPAEAAPSVTLVVKRIPEGLPNVLLNGRRGGRGQPGQDGGHGEDGARGRESTSSAFWCVTDVGSGGKGGKGGNGGKGGPGGPGGRGGSIRVFATPENLVTLLARQSAFIGVSQGPGGPGGVGGGPGAGGQGGLVGNDTGWCEADAGEQGAPGLIGGVGGQGDDGPLGGKGSFSTQPITESDWDEAFTLPYVTRLEPQSGHAGDKIHLAGLNFTTAARIWFDGSQLKPDSINVGNDTLEFTVPPDASGGVKVVALAVPPPENPILRELSNSLNFRVLPRLSEIVPQSGLPGTSIELRGTGLSAGASVRFGSRLFPATLLSTGRLSFKLPGFEDIGMAANPHDVSVVNPDGQTSNALSFQLEIEIVVRVKAWRVLDSDDDGTGRDDDDIREIFDHEFSPDAIWRPHGIHLEFDRNIGIARVNSDLASTWPESNTAESDAAKEELLKFHPGQERPFVSHAINFYFVNDIDDATTHAYAGTGSAAPANGSDPKPIVIFEDTGLLSVEDEAHVAAHEIGHIFGLPHVPDDSDFLMYKNASKFLNEGNTISPVESQLARSFARNLHRKAPPL